MVLWWPSICQKLSLQPVKRSTPPTARAVRPQWASFDRNEGKRMGAVVIKESAGKLVANPHESSRTSHHFKPY
jgi:hypothetical protein